MGGKADEKSAAVKAVAIHGWSHVRTTKKGYFILRCACGAHQETLHKTPSDPRHFSNKISRMISQCSDR